MEKIEQMDILRVPSKDEITISKITKWLKSTHDNNNVSTFVFKRDTPQEIFDLYENSLDLFPKILYFNVNPRYEIEK